MKKQNWIFIPSLLLFILYIVLSVYNRFSHDDLQYLKSVQLNGIIDSTLLNYSNWNTRWAAVLLANTFFSFISTGTLLWIFHLTTLAVLLVSVVALFSSVNKTFMLRIKSNQQRLFSLLFVFLLWFNTFSIGDVWFWLNASCMYLWNVSAFFLAIAFILSQNKTGIKSLLISLSGIYIGGSSEPFVIFTIAISAMFYVILRKHNIPFSGILFFVFALSVLAGFAVSFFGQGNSIRQQALPDTSFVERNFIFIKAVVKLWALYMPQKIVGSLLIAFPFAVAGAACKSKAGPSHVRTLLVTIAGMLLFFSSLMLYSIVIIMSEAGPERAWTSISVLLSMCMAYLFFETGRAGVFSANGLSKFYASCIILLSAILLLVVLNQITVLKTYAAAYDMRMLVLKNIASKKIHTTVYLPKLPSSGLLRSAEITIDSSYFTNQQLKYFYDLPADVAIRP